MRAPERRSLSLRQRKAEAHQKLKEELQTTIAQRHSFSLAMTSFSPECTNRSRGPSASHPSRVSTETRRRGKGTMETEKKTNPGLVAPLSSESHQAGSRKRVKLTRGL